MPHYTIETIEWEVTYPLQPEPVGRIRRRAGAFHAKLADQLLGSHPTGDHAVEAVWDAYLAANRSQHAAAAVTHGGAERHPAPHR